MGDENPENEGHQTLGWGFPWVFGVAIPVAEYPLTSRVCLGENLGKIPGISRVNQELKSNSATMHN